MNFFNINGIVVIQSRIETNEFSFLIDNLELAIPMRDIQRYIKTSSKMCTNFNGWLSDYQMEKFRIFYSLNDLVK